MCQLKNWGSGEWESEWTRTQPALMWSVQMEAVILVGIQASGKSTFCRERFYDSHIRINCDMLRTRHREKLLLQACVAARQSFVVDNTNATRDERAKYIDLARRNGFRITGFYFASKVDECKRRNENRPDIQYVPVQGLLGTYKRLELPALAEGFDSLNYVSIAKDGTFNIAEWKDEI